MSQSDQFPLDCKSLKTPEMHPMLSKNWMEELCVAAECVLSYPMGKSAQGAVAILRPMAVADALEMILDDVVLQSDAGGGAAVAAGLFQEIEADSALCPETTRRAQDQSPGQGVVPGLTTENEDPKAMGWPSYSLCNTSLLN
ncbi:hypothetical protein CesoFtcFv8_002421 [Champsocephalus esox]|uniref:Uncharacterized protein n=1 Tax=Champsocephalus esox TaxID=159716 RepID=A0AAN8HEP8_9TELE|nr:hypothetical protein CesoFtcFv8_002421 [Champsocephalus esox]